MAYRAGMPSSRVVRVRSLHDGVAAEVVRDGVARIQEELDVDPAFPPEVEAAAAAAARSPRLPDLDRTDLELVTIDPEGSRDLDQALHGVSRYAARNPWAFLAIAGGAVLLNRWDDTRAAV